VASPNWGRWKRGVNNRFVSSSASSVGLAKADAERGDVCLVGGDPVSELRILWGLCIDGLGYWEGMKCHCKDGIY
jgi:hypothetical protein